MKQLNEPWVDYFNSTMLKITDITCCYSRSMASCDCRQLAISEADRHPYSSSTGSDHCVQTRGIAVKGKNASLEIFPKHILDFRCQSFTPKTRGQNCNAEAQLGFSDSREVYIFSDLRIKPRNHGGIRRGTRQF